jgi:hypothetical protein
MDRGWVRSDEPRERKRGAARDFCAGLLASELMFFRRGYPGVESNKMIHHLISVMQTGET